MTEVGSEYFVGKPLSDNTTGTSLDVSNCRHDKGIPKVVAGIGETVESFARSLRVLSKRDDALDDVKAF